MMIKCEMYSISLELTVGMARTMDRQKQMQEWADGLSYGHMNTLKQGMQSLRNKLEEGAEDTQNQIQMYMG